MKGMKQCLITSKIVVLTRMRLCASFHITQKSMKAETLLIDRRKVIGMRIPPVWIRNEREHLLR